MGQDRHTGRANRRTGRKPRNVMQFRGHRPSPGRRQSRRSIRIVEGLLSVLGLSLGAFLSLSALHISKAADAAEAASFACTSPQVLDGDTLDCGSRRVRLDGIDAPELPGHCRPGRHCTPGDPHASTESLRALIAGRDLTCRPTGLDPYGRTVARCETGLLDLSCAQLDNGQAVRRYGWIWCGW